MILVDTSTRIYPLRTRDEHLCARLDHGRVLSHPSVVGELALGNLNNRRAILDLDARQTVAGFKPSS